MLVVCTEPYTVYTAKLKVLLILAVLPNLMLSIRGDFSILSLFLFNQIQDLITQAEGAEKPLVLLLGSTDGSLEIKELTDVAIVKAFPDITDSSTISDDICSQLVALVVGAQCEINLAFLSRCPKLKTIIQFGMGTDNIELEYAGRLGIIVCNVPDYGIEEVADTAMAHILTLFRQTIAFHMNVVNGTEYRTYKDIMSDAKCRRIRGKTLGLVGLGKTGFAVAQRAKAFGFNVAFYDPFIGTGWDKAFGGLERFKSLTDLVMKSDCVSLHCMLSEESRHIVNEPLLRVFKRGAYLVNVSRGPLIDEAALARALKEGWIAGAALDVHEEEPFSFKRSALKGAPNLICTPHISWYSKEGFTELRSSGIRLIRQVLTVTDPTGIQNCVNQKHLDSEACMSRWNTTVD